MNMKKYLLSFAVMLTGTALLTGCLNDDNDGPSSWTGYVSKGAYVICGGNQGNAIPSSMTYIDYKNESAEQNFFTRVNYRELGSTANDAIVYGSKMYVVVSGENTIEVLDSKTGYSIRQISTVGLTGGDQGVNPRHITAGNGAIYVSTYGGSSSEYDENWNQVTSGNGYVVAIDTASFAMKNIYTAGSYPEGLYVTEKNLYVANSDYSAGKRASISVIDLGTGSATEKTHANIRNPQDVVVLADGRYFFLDWGQYDSNWNQVNAGVYLVDGDNVSKVIENATMWVPISFSNGYTVASYIYTVNAPYGSSSVTYDRYDLSTNSRTQFTTDGVFSPSAIGVDPLSGYVFIASYKQNPDTGKADYSANGYVKVYDTYGKVWKEFECGVGPNAFAFNVGIETVTLQ